MTTESERLTMVCHDCEGEGYSSEYLSPCPRCGGSGNLPASEVADQTIAAWLDDLGDDTYREINLRAYGQAPDEHGVAVPSGVVATAYFARGAIRGWAVSLSDGAFGPSTASALVALAERLPNPTQEIA